MSIPVIDLNDYTGNDAAVQKKFVADLGRAYEETGFVAVANHGIPEQLIGELYDLMPRFFALPEATKEKYGRPELAGQRGYTSFGKEHAKGYEAPDLKEFFQFGQVVTGEASDIPAYPDNVLVDEIQDFTPSMLRAYQYFEQSGTILLQAIAQYLDMDAHFFDSEVQNGNSILRAIYYPPITSEPQSAIRAEQHEDINLITLLVGSSAEGLQLLDRKGAWIPVSAHPQHIVVNVGDMLQRLTNNRLRSTTHRVVNPPRDKWGQPRYSIPFFLHPKRTMSLACLESCITTDNPKAYIDYSAGQYLDERLEEIGLKK